MGCAAVGIRILDDQDNIPYKFYDGFSRSFYELESPLSIKSDKCMCINVIKGEIDPKLPFYTEGGSFYMNGTTRFLSTVSEKEKGQTRNVCNQVGYESVALIPVRLKSQILGLIHVADPRENIVPLKKVEVLEKAGLQLGTVLLRRQAEEKVRKSEASLAEAQHIAHLGSWEWDLINNNVYWSNELFEIFGLPVKDSGLDYKSVLDFIHPEDRELVQKRVSEALQKGKYYHVEYRIVCPDGTERIVHAQGNAHLNGDGKPTKFVETVQDITVHKQAEKEMEVLQEQLRQSQKMEAIGRLAGGIAHDFNNLPTVIKGCSQLSLLELKEGDPVRENTVEINEAAERAADLTRQLLTFSRRQVIEMKVFDLNAILENLDKVLRRVIAEDIVLLTLLKEDLGMVRADPGQIEQVIMNLAINARDAMPSGGKLTIETANMELDEEYTHTHMAVKPGQYVMFSVSDTGYGMSPEVKSRIFEPFFTTKEKGKGTGLGLSTVYGIVKQSEGHIWVYSEPEQGTAFKIYLPRVYEATEEREEKLVKEELPSGSETILVVEDEEKVRKLIVQVLKRQGYSILEAPHGDDALLVCNQHGGLIHLLVTDVVMPGMSGSEVARRLASRYPKMKVLYTSGYTDNAIVHYGVLQKKANYIQKPFTMEGLATKVRQVLDR